VKYKLRQIYTSWNGWEAKIFIQGSWLALQNVKAKNKDNDQVYFSDVCVFGMGEALVNFYPELPGKPPNQSGYCAWEGQGYQSARIAQFASAGPSFI
jgi:hypothetical protein